MKLPMNIDELEARIIAKIEEKLTQRRSPETVIDMPTQAPKVGHRYIGSRSDIRARIDSELFKLLDSDSKRLCAGNTSRMLDIILWYFYNKPPLSHQLLDNQQEER